MAANLPNNARQHLAGPLPRQQVTAFAIAAGPSVLLGLPFTIYLPPFVAAGDMMSIGLVGLMFSIATLWDGVVDPLIGTMVDRSRSRGVAYRTWMRRAAGPLIFLLGLLLSFGDSLPFLVIFPILLLFFSSYSLYDVSHLSWGSSLANTADDSTRLFGAREMMSKLILILAFALPAGAQMLIPGLSLQGRIIAYASLTALAMPLALLAITRLPNIPPPPLPTAAMNWRDELRISLRFHPLMLLFAIQFCNSFAFGALTALFVYYADGVLGLDTKSSLLLFSVFVGGALTTPLWTMVARRVGKRRGMIAMVVILALISLGGLIFVPKGLGPAIGLSMLLGSGFVGLLFTYAMLTDLLPDDRKKCGRDRSAFLFAIINLMQKAGTAAAIGLCYLLLQVGDFDARDAAASGDAIRWMFAGLPGLAWLSVAALLLWSGRAAPLASAASSH